MSEREKQQIFDENLNILFFLVICVNGRHMALKRWRIKLEAYLRAEELWRLPQVWTVMPECLIRTNNVIFASICASETNSCIANELVENKFRGIIWPSSHIPFSELSENWFIIPICLSSRKIFRHCSTKIANLGCKSQFSSLTIGAVWCLAMQATQLPVGQSHCLFLPSHCASIKPCNELDWGTITVQQNFGSPCI